jgi:hypothetical protein
VGDAIEATTVPFTVRVRRFARMTNGITKQQTTIVQNAGANGPEIFAHQTAMWTGSPP